MYDFENVAEYMKAAVCGKMGVPGCDIIVTRGHKRLYRHIEGFSDLERRVPLTESNLYYMYSCTKPVTVTAAMRLVEEGKLRLDDPVSLYMPEFAELYLMRDGERVKAKNVLTVRHLFTMTGGFDYNMLNEYAKEVIESSGGKAGTVEICRTHALRPLLFEPGERFQYSVCHDILAAVVELASGMKFSEYLGKIMFEPLGMTDSTFYETDDVKARIAAQYFSDGGRVKRHADTNGFHIAPNYESGGAGLIMSADDYAVFADTMAMRGQSANGYRLLRPETVDLMKTEQLSSFTVDKSFSCAAGPGYGYGLGVRTRISHEGGKSPLGEFGWDGAAGSYVMMDAENGLSIFFAMHVLNWPSCIGSAHAVMRDMIYDGLRLRDD